MNRRIDDMRPLSALWMVILINALVMATVAGVSTKASLDTQLIEQYAFVNATHSMECELPPYNSSTMSGNWCNWWQQDTMLAAGDVYQVTTLDIGRRCRLKISRVKMHPDASPTEYRCSAGDNLANASPVTIRLWTVVKPHITVSGKEQKSIDLSEWPVDDKPTIGCSVTTVRPAAQLLFRLNDQNLKTEPATLRDDDGNRSTAFISWRDDLQQLTNSQWIGCRAEHSSYPGESEWTFLDIVGQYGITSATNRTGQVRTSTTTQDDSTTVSATQQRALGGTPQTADVNVVLLAVGGTAALLFIIFMALLFVTLYRRRRCRRNAPAVVAPKTATETVATRNPTLNMSRPVSNTRQQETVRNGRQMALTSTSELDSSQMALTDTVYYEQNDIYEMSSFSNTALPST